MGSVRKRNESWQAVVGSRAERESRTFRTKELAEKWVAEREKIRHHLRGSESANITLIDKNHDWALMAHISNLLSKDDILRLSKPYQPLCGVYFLIKKEKVFYIGQSQNVFKRVTQHHNKGFDRLFVLPCSALSLDVLETIYIKMFKPSGNKMEQRGRTKISDETLRDITRLAKEATQTESP